jgi:hypothetical protein
VKWGRSNWFVPALQDGKSTSALGDIGLKYNTMPEMKYDWIAISAEPALI